MSLDLTELFTHLTNALARDSTLAVPILGLISFISNAIPYFTIPYLALVLVYTSYVGIRTAWTIAALIIVSAACAALGKVVVYYLGRGFSRIVLSGVDLNNIRLFNKLFDKGIFLAIFIFAASPLPDDILYVPVGVLKYPVYKFYLACFLGKTVITSIVALGGGTIRTLMAYVVHSSSPTSVGILSTVVSILITIFVLLLLRRIDWTRLVQTLSNKGVVQGAIEIMRNPGLYIRRRGQ